MEHLDKRFLFLEKSFKITEIHPTIFTGESYWSVKILWPVLTGRSLCVSFCIFRGYKNHISMRTNFFFCCAAIFLFSFSPKTEAVATDTLPPERPNILWISAEDLSPRMAAYGDSTISTPNLDRLANEGIVFEHAYTTAGVCAPARNAIITGRYQTSNGGHNMRTMGNTYPEQTGLPESYNSVPPASVRCFPEYLRAAGYYTSNNVKTDYQFTAPPTVWDESSDTATWRNRPEGKPFFSVMNFTTTHESQIWKRADNPMRADPKKVTLPPYYPDTEISRQDVARHYSNLSELDDQIGEIFDKLEEDGLMDNTIIFFWGDHGDGLPFYKREIYRRGIHIPLIVRFPDKKDAGSRNKEFISAIDLGPTVMSLAGLETPSQMHGRAFLGEHKAEKGRDLIFAARDRLDSEYDRVRSVMDGRYQYIRNFRPQKPLYMDIQYRKSIPTMRMLLEMREKDELNEEQSFWFKETKPEEELYDWVEDPYQLNNLAGEAEHAETIKKLRSAMDEWLIDTEDLGGVPEKELVEQMWNGGDSQPVTARPIVYHSDGKFKIKSLTTGASIAYRKLGDEHWNVYTGETELPKGQYETMAMRIGYEPSETVNFEN